VDELRRGEGERRVSGKGLCRFDVRPEDSWLAAVQAERAEDVFADPQRNADHTADTQFSCLGRELRPAKFVADVVDAHQLLGRGSAQARPTFRVLLEDVQLVRWRS